MKYDKVCLRYNKVQPGAWGLEEHAGVRPLQGGARSASKSRACSCTGVAELRVRNDIEQSTLTSVAALAEPLSVLPRRWRAIFHYESYMRQLLPLLKAEERHGHQAVGAGDQRVLLCIEAESVEHSHLVNARCRLHICRPEFETAGMVRRFKQSKLCVRACVHTCVRTRTWEEPWPAAVRL